MLQIYYPHDWYDIGQAKICSFSKYSVINVVLFHRNAFRGRQIALTTHCQCNLSVCSVVWIIVLLFESLLMILIYCCCFFSEQLSSELLACSMVASSQIFAWSKDNVRVDQIPWHKSLPFWSCSPSLMTMILPWGYEKTYIKQRIHQSFHLEVWFDSD